MSAYLIKAKLTSGEDTYLHLSGIGRFEFVVRKGLPECTGFHHLKGAPIGEALSRVTATRFDSASAVLNLSNVSGNMEFFQEISSVEIELT